MLLLMSKHLFGKIKTSSCKGPCMLTVCKLYMFYEFIIWSGQMSVQHMEALITSLKSWKLVFRQGYLAILACMKPKVMLFASADSLQCIQN